MHRCECQASSLQGRADYHEPALQGSVGGAPASRVYNATVPSLETIISREALWRSTVTLKIDVANEIDQELAVSYGITGALSPFPHT